jgi:hypothetical protein
VGEGVDVAVVVVDSVVGLTLDDGPGGDSGEHPASTTTADSRRSPVLVRITAVLSTSHPIRERTLVPTGK